MTYVMMKRSWLILPLCSDASTVESLSAQHSWSLELLAALDLSVIDTRHLLKNCIVSLNITTVAVLENILKVQTPK
jgi:hypothetical protein